MAFCGNCGAQVNDGVKFCSSCGAGMPDAQGQTAASGGAAGPEVRQADPNDAEQNKLMAILAYILFFIPLVTGDYKKSPFVLFHTNQGTVLFISAVVYSIAYIILSAILAFIPFLGWALILLLGLFWFVFLVFCIMGIINAANGKMKPLPVIGTFTIIK